MFCTNCGKEIPDTSQFCTYCGSAVNQKNLIQTTSQKNIKAVFNRPKKFVGCAVSMKIYIDGNVATVLKNGESKEVEVPCGKHKVIVEMWSAISEREVEFSEEFSKMYIDVGIKMGFWANKAEIIAIKNEK